MLRSSPVSHLKDELQTVLAASKEVHLPFHPLRGHAQRVDISAYVKMEEYKSAPHMSSHSQKY